MGFNAPSIVGLITWDIYIYNSSNSTRYFGLPKQGVYLQFDGNVDGDDDDDARDLRVLRFKTQI